jgi:asparagine synthase (glutamine-hydrolysing)
MCGIAGIVALDGRKPELHELDSMASALVHRGPDSGGTLLGAQVGLTMRRLSIIDVETGTQPLANEDRSIWTVFNGEIYNHAELRHELERRGHTFRTRSDTEVLVHLYEELGPRCVEPLRGMFAFAIWDERERTLLLARDRLGIKPLFYTRVDGRLAFASELKALLALPGIPREIDHAALDNYFAQMSTPSSQSILAGIRKLEPGHVLLSSPARALRTYRYWRFEPAPDRSRSESYFVERLRELLEESVRLHMVSDVPVGAFLSGGLDSSAVVATMARLAPRSLQTFSVGFRESAYDESRHARELARRVGAEHHELVLEPDVFGILDEVAWHLDEPFGDVSALPTFVLSRLAAEHVKVVLSGDGGDELFGGYERYLVERRERRYELVPRTIRRAIGAVATRLPQGTRGRGFLRHLALDYPHRYLDATTLFRREDRQRLLGQPAGAAPPERLEFLRRSRQHWLTSLQALDLHFYLPLDILTKVDRMSMAHSLEARVPLLDHRLVEFAASVPPQLNVRGGTTKYLFRRAIEGLVPPDVLRRPKHGFAVPLERWLRGGLTSCTDEILLGDSTRRRGILDPAFVTQVVARHRRGQELDLHLWSMISFELWCRVFLDRAASPPLRPRRESPDRLVRLPAA